jgi:hypothetical protein
MAIAREISRGHCAEMFSPRAGGTKEKARKRCANERRDTYHGQPADGFWRAEMPHAAAPQSACTAEELVQATGLHLKTIQSYVLTLHREHGCYIESWDEDAAGRQTIARYMIGQKPDAKRPRRPSGERARAYRARKAQERTLLAIQGRLS